MMEQLNISQTQSGQQKLQSCNVAMLEMRESHRSSQLFSPFTIGLGMLCLLLVVLLTGPIFAQFSPSAVNSGPRLSPPGPIHWFGTDALGRDLFSRISFGFRISIGICIAATIITAAPGITLGLVSGYFQGWIDLVFSRLVDVLLSLPGLLLAIVLIARLGPSMLTLIFALGITGIPTFYRITRNETISMSKQSFVDASRSLGISNFSLIVRHIFPNIFPTLLVLTSMRIGIYLLMGSGLGFIGLGIQPPLSEIGALMAYGKEYFQTAWWLFTFPAIYIFLTVLALNLTGEGLRDRYSHS